MPEPVAVAERCAAFPACALAQLNLQKMKRGVGSALPRRCQIALYGDAMVEAAAADLGECGAELGGHLEDADSIGDLAGPTAAEFVIGVVELGLGLAKTIGDGIAAKGEGIFKDGLGTMILGQI